MDSGTPQRDHCDSLDSYGIPMEFRNEFRTAASSSQATEFAIALEKIFVWVLVPLAAIPLLLLTLRAAEVLEYSITTMLSILAASLWIRRTRRWRWDGDGLATPGSKPILAERLERWLLSSLPLEIVAAVLAVLFLPLGLTDIPREQRKQRDIPVTHSYESDHRLVFLYEKLANSSLEITEPGFLLGRRAPTIRPGGI